MQENVIASHAQGFVAPVTRKTTPPATAVTSEIARVTIEILLLILGRIKLAHRMTRISDK